MKYQLLILFIGLTLYNQDIQSQSAPNIEFNNVEINWFHLHEDQTLPALFESYDNVNSEGDPSDIFFRDTKIIGDKIFNLFTTTLNTGSYIDAIDLKTGSKIWSNPYNALSDTLSETLLSIFEREDGNIELTGFRIANVVPNAVPIGPATRRTLDIETGESLSDVFSTDFGEGACFCVNPNAQFGRVFPITDDELYLASCMYVNSNLNTIHWQRSLDGEGFTKDTLAYTEDLVNEPSFKYIDGIRLPNGNIAVGISTYFFPTVFDRRLSEILIISSSGELLDRIDITEFISFAGFFYMDLRGENIYINAPSLNEDQSEYTKENLVIMNQNGVILNSYSDFDELDGQSVSWIRSASLDNEQSVIVGSDIFSDKHCLKIFTSDNEGNIKHLSTICHPESNWQLFTRSIFEYEDNLIIQGDWRLSDEISYPATFSISLDELGVLSSTENIKEDLSGVSHFPNPVIDNLQIKFEELSSGTIQISDLSGKLVSTLKYSNQNSINIDIANIEMGTYILKIETDKGSKISKLIKSN